MRLFGRFSNTMPFLWLWRTVKVNWQTPKYPMFTARMKILGRMDPLALFLPSWSPFCRETFGGKRISYDGRNFQWTNATLVCRIWKQAKSRNLSDSAGTRFLQTSGRSKGTICNNLSMENETFLVIFMYNDSDKAFMMLICFYITVCLQFDGLWQEVWQCTHGRFHFGLAGSSGCGGQNFCHFQRIVFQSKFNISTKVSRPKVSKNSKKHFFLHF